MADNLDPRDIETELDAAAPEGADQPAQGARGDEPDEDEIRLTASEKTRREARERAEQEEKERIDQGKTGRKPGDSAAPGGENDPISPVVSGPGAMFMIKHKMHDKGDWISYRGAQRERGNPLKQLTDDQLRALLVTAIVHKGWHNNIAFYRGNHIDSQLASRARTMLAIDVGVKTALAAAGVTEPPQIQMTLTPEPPPWLKNSMLPNMHTSRYNAQERKFRRMGNESMRDALRATRRFDGEGAKEIRAGLKEKLFETGGVFDKIRAGGPIKTATHYMNSATTLASGMLGAVWGTHARPEDPAAAVPPAEEIGPVVTASTASDNTARPV